MKRRRLRYGQADVAAILIVMGFVPIIVSDQPWAVLLCVVTVFTGLVLLLTKWRF